MKRTAWLIVYSVVAFASSARADTLHAVADGAYWHHDSGWIMPERIGEFVRVGMPQDVAGSTDVIAYYARSTGERIIASVDIYRRDSAINDHTSAEANASFATELGAATPSGQGEFTVSAGALTAAVSRTAFVGADRSAPRWLLYFATVGDWRVKVRVTSPSARSELPALADAFVRGLRWDSLAPVAR